MNIRGYELITEWKNSQCGQTAVARRGDKQYFIKKYQTPVEPVMNGSLDKRTFAHNQEVFRRFVEIRRRVNNALRPIAGSGGNIVIPIEDFIENHHYMEVAELVNGTVGEEELEEVLAGLSLEVKQLLMLTAAGALDTIHKKGVIHSDLKLQNVLLAKNGERNYVAKVIDFDSSYFSDCLPEEIVGTIDYYSPELGQYADSEDEREELGKTLTTQSDIFSLGLIFHMYLTGEMPQAKSLTERLQKRKDKGKPIYCWTILNSGCELKLSDKISSFKYLCLIQDMLESDPQQRPTATQVLQRLKGVEERFIFEDAWPEDRIVLDIAKLKENGYVLTKRNRVGDVKGYLLRSNEGKKVVCTGKELITKGLAKMARVERFVEPWPEHKIVFDEEKIQSRGFVGSEQSILGDTKGYMFFKVDGTERFIKAEMLLLLKMANKTA